MSRKIGLKVLYGLIAVIALVGACGGISAEEITGEWIADNVYKNTNDYIDTYWIYDDKASTVREFVIRHASNDGQSVSSIEELAQVTIDMVFGEVLDGYKVNWVQYATAHGNEILFFSKKSGEKQVDLSVHCLLIGACDGISTEEWAANNVFTHTHDSEQGSIPYSHTTIHDDDTATVRDLILPFYVKNVDEFERDIQAMSDNNLGDTTDSGYKNNWIQSSVEFDGEILLFSQKLGENSIFISVPSLVDFSTFVSLSRPAPSAVPTSASKDEKLSASVTCSKASDPRICGHLSDIEENYPDLTTCFDYCMYEILSTPQTWDEFSQKCLRLHCQALYDSKDKVQLNNGVFMKELEYIWENLRTIR